MANVKLIFSGSDISETENHQLQCFVNNYNEILIEISMEGFLPSFISLDKSTAIKFSKTLRTEINKIETEVSND